MMVKKERPADGWPWQKSPNRPYFVYDPEGDDFQYYATEQERDTAAADAIQGYLDDCWSEEVENVIAGVLTHTAERCDVVNRPDDSELDEDNLDGEGQYWGEYDGMCNYELKKLSLTCWACNKEMTFKARSDNDGFCIHCNNEIEL